MKTTRAANRDLTLTTYVEAVGAALTHASLRSLARRPLEQQAKRLIESCPAADLSRFTGERTTMRTG